VNTSLNNIRSFWKTQFYCFLFLCVLFIPFPFYLFSFQQEITSFLFGPAITFLLQTGWGIDTVNNKISSDSQNLYALVLLLFILATIISLILTNLKNWQVYRDRIFQIIRLVFTYYLALQLLKYGFHKLFKAQFYLPEPNTLYTPLGQVSKDLMFWSTMGTSYGYNVFMGLLEIIPAILLLFRKTRLLGLLIAFPVLLHVVAINFGFDISVKVYSIFLCGLAFILLFPYFKKLFGFIVLGKTDFIESPEILMLRKPAIRLGLKTFMIALIFIEALMPYFMTMQFNDDNSPRPYLHGAYEVQNVFLNKEKVDPSVLAIKRIFVHRNGYLIFQNTEDQMQDFKLKTDTIKKELILQDYQGEETKLQFNYFEKDSLLELQFFRNGKEYWLYAKALDWQNLPALQKDFHWTIEGVE